MQLHRVRLHRHRPGRNLHTRIETGLSENTCYVGLGRLLAHDHGFGDVVIRLALSDQKRRLTFAISQPNLALSAAALGINPVSGNHTI